MSCTCAGTAPGYPKHEDYCGRDDAPFADLSPVPGDTGDTEMTPIERAVEAAELVLKDDYRLASGDALDAASDALRVALPVLLADLQQRIEAAKPHIPISTDPNRRTAIIQRCTLNNAVRIVDEFWSEVAQ